MSPFVEESEPLETLKDLLNDNWVSYQECPLPEILVVNDPDEAISRINLMDNDYVVISMSGNEEIRPRGNFAYNDRIFPIALNILTKESRQRMRNISKIVRSICFMKKHNFTGWQLIRPLRFTEMIGTDINLWRGQFLLQLENHAVFSEISV